MPTGVGQSGSFHIDLDRSETAPLSPSSPGLWRYMGEILQVGVGRWEYDLYYCRRPEASQHFEMSLSYLHPLFLTGSPHQRLLGIGTRFGCLGKIDATQLGRRCVSGAGKDNGDSAGSKSYQQRVTPASSTQEKTRKVQCSIKEKTWLTSNRSCKQLAAVKDKLVEFFPANE